MCLIHGFHIRSDSDNAWGMGVWAVLGHIGDFAASTGEAWWLVMEAHRKGSCLSFVSWVKCNIMSKGSLFMKSFAGYLLSFVLPSCFNKLEQRAGANHVPLQDLFLFVSSTFAAKGALLAENVPQSRNPITKRDQKEKTCPTDRGVAYCSLPNQLSLYHLMNENEERFTVSDLQKWSCGLDD